MFSASDVKTLREKTGAGMMDCKKALEASNGNMEDAITWLREKGISKAAKKADRIAAEGLTKAMEDGNKAVILEVNSETDFVAKNEEFTNFMDKLSNALVNSDAKSMEDANKLEIDGETVEQAIISLTAKIGEKISFRRFEIVKKTDEEVFGIYSHMGGKITALVVIEGANIDVARDVAMHTAAMRPTYLNESEIPSDVLEKEKTIIKNELLNEGKPEDRIEQIMVGKLRKF